MEAAFANLEKQGKTDVDSLVKWMKDSKIINETKEQEDKVRAYFNEVGDKKKVQLSEFQEAMKKVSEEFKKNLDGMMKQLADIGPQLLQTARDGAASTLTGVGGALKGIMGLKKS